MNTYRILILALAAVAVISVYSGWKLTARGAYESADYMVVETDGAFEIREYPPLQMATTDMRGFEGDDGSFMRLFRYISGGNDDQQKIAMTVPVFMAPAQEEARGQMGFVLPRKFGEREIPGPSDQQVKIKKRAGGRFAVVRFSGRINKKAFAKAEKQLHSWMTKKGLTAEGSAEFAGYDPPWTPAALRRNEVLIRLQQTPDSAAP